MADTVRAVDYYYVTTSDRPGQGADLLSVFRDAGVNLLAVHAFPERRRVQVDLVPENARAFTAAIRARVFALLRAWSNGDDEAALDVLDADGRDWTAGRLARAREAFTAENGGLRLDPEGRNRRHTHTRPSADGAALRVEQMLVDVEGHNDWVAEFEVDLAASRAAGEPVVRLLRLADLTA